MQPAISGRDAGRPRGICATGLTKRYGNRIVVDDLTFSASAGVVTGFLGPNGAGKSTTLRMILGLAKPTAGTVTIDGQHIADIADAAQAVGALLDAGAVHPQRSAFDHLQAFALAAGLGRRRVGEVLELTGLSRAAARPAGEFSLGMKQRLGIATALLGDPQALILDEPLNGLDPEGIRWMRTLMRDLASEGRTVLFSSHLMSEMELTADDLIVIGEGRLIAESPLEQFIRFNTTQVVRVRTAHLAELAMALGRAGLKFTHGPDSLLLPETSDASIVGRIAAAEGIALDELTSIRESLEEVFLRLTHHATGHRA